MTPFHYWTLIPVFQWKLFPLCLASSSLVARSSLASTNRWSTARRLAQRPRAVLPETTIPGLRNATSTRITRPARQYEPIRSWFTSLKYPVVSGLFWCPLYTSCHIYSQLLGSIELWHLPVQIFEVLIQFSVIDNNNNNNTKLINTEWGQSCLLSFWVRFCTFQFYSFTKISYDGLICYR